MSDIIPINTAELVVIDNQPLDQNPAAIYLAGLKPTGRRTMHQVLNVVANLLEAPDVFSCPWAELRFQHVAAIRGKLEETYKPATVNKALAAIRGVLRAAWLSGQMSAEDYHRAAAVKSVRGSTLPAGRALTPGEIAALMAACEKDTTPAGARDAAFIAVGYGCGLRRDELAGLLLADYTPDTGELVIRGKGSKERLAWLENGTARAMADWLDVRGLEDGALFVAIDKGGNLDTSKGMNSQAIYNMTQKRGKAAGVAHFSPHDLRRSFVSDLLDAGADIATVAKMAGHASVNTTARYDRRPEEAKRKAAGLLHVPYHGRQK